MSDLVAPLVDGIADLPLWTLALAVAVAVACESSLLVGLLVPGDLVVLLAAAGATTESPLPRLVVLVVAVTAGSLAGEALGYGIGRRWGAVVRRSRPGRALGPGRWARAEELVERHGGRAVLGARYLAAVHAVLPVAAGMLRMPAHRFLGWSAAGALSWATVYVTVGTVAGTSVRRAGDYLSQATVVLVGLLIVVAALVATRVRRRHRASAHGALPMVADPPVAAGACGGKGARVTAAALAPPAADGTAAGSATAGRGARRRGAAA